MHLHDLRLVVRHGPLAALLTLLLPVPGVARAAVVEAGTAQELSARAAALKPGDELAVRAGIYSDCRFEIGSKGTQEKPIVVRPQVPGTVLFRRDTRISITGDWVEFRGFHFEECGPGIVVITFGAQHARITDCRFLHCGNPRSTFTHIVEVGENSSDNRVDHCYFEGSKSMSIGLRIRSAETTGRRAHFDHNTFRDIFPLSSNGQEPIQLGQGGISDPVEAQALVEYNVFDNAGGDVEAVSNKSSRNTIRWNVVANCRAALVLRGGQDCLVEGNILARNSQSLRVYGARHVIINNLFLELTRTGILLGAGNPGYARAEDCLVANNTFVDCKHGAVACGTAPEPGILPRGNRILNNLIACHEGPLIDLGTATDSEVLGNLLWGMGKAETGAAGTGAIFADPLLAGQEAALCPGAGSPAVDRALPLPQVTRDRRGNPRPAGKAPDIGADEVPAPPTLGVPGGSGTGAGALEPLVIPPARPAFDPEALKGELLFAMDGKDPASGWEPTGGEAKAQGSALAVSGGALWLQRELPADFVAEWQYSPGTLDARASVTFAASGRKGGYVLAWGGARDKDPEGVATLAKGNPGAVLADGHDTVVPADKHPKLPDPKLWYSCRLVKRGGRLTVDFGRSPIIECEDTGVLGGPALGAGAFGISQTGTGTWCNLRVWACR